MDRPPAEAFEALILDQLQRFADPPPITVLEAAGRLIRIDLRTTSLELVCEARALQPKLHPELALDEIASRVQPGEKVLADTPDAKRIRISLPIRAQFRGGRTWIEGKVAALRPKTAKPKPQIATALRRAHLVARALGASPLRGDMQAVASPANTYETRLVRLAFLSPDLQLDLLQGRHAEHLSVVSLLSGEPPLLWGEQKRWLERL